VQTLVENAIKHGIESVPDGGTVSITADLLPDGLLEVRISNPGFIVNGEKPGRGLAISRDRLRILGGGCASLELSPGPDAGQVTAIVRFPQPRQL
jgi:LytS/YehU family sensor histidine kinase